MDVYRALAKRADLLPSVQLQPYQQRVADKLRDHDRLLVYHGLGSGKSLSSVAAAEQEDEPYTAITPAALRENYRKEQRKFTDGSTPTDVMSYNAVAAGKQPKYPGTLVVDEAHRLRSPESAQTAGVKQLAEQAKKVLLLSGSPIVNRPADLAPLIEILTKQKITPGEFNQKFLGETEVSPGWLGWMQGIKPVKVKEPAHVDQLKKLLRGHVDYYAPAKPPVETTEVTNDVEMGPEQQLLYRSMWGKLPFWLKWKLQNEFPLSDDETRNAMAFLSGPRQVSLSTLPFMKGNPNPQKAFDQSPKLQKAFQSLQETLKRDPAARAVVYSNFIGAGLEPYAAALKKHRISHGLFAGGMTDAQRKAMVDEYNAGQRRVLLLGPAGSEGISLKGTNLMQLLDGHWANTRLQQAIGRGVRLDSHTHLPAEQRKVLVERYRSKLPPSFWSRMFSMDGKPQYGSGVDDYIERAANQKEELNNKFLKVLQEVGSEP